MMKIPIPIFKVDFQNIKISFVNSKPGENRGRKAMGLIPVQSGYDCQVAEKGNQFILL